MSAPTLEAPDRGRTLERRKSARPLEQALLRSICQLERFEVAALRLKQRIEEENGDSSLRDNLDFVIHEIESGKQALESRASNMRLGGSRSPFPPTGGQAKAAFTPLSKQVARLAAGVKLCGKRVCALLRAALAFGDSLCAQAAYAILRVLERELWLLRPKSGAAPSFVALVQRLKV